MTRFNIPRQRRYPMRPKWEWIRPGPKYIDVPRPAPLYEHIEDAPMLAEMWAALLTPRKAHE